MSSLCLDVAGIRFRLDGLTQSQNDAVRENWPDLLQPSSPGLEGVLPVALRRETPSSFAPEPAGTAGPQELELELDYGCGHTEMASTDLKGRLEWTGDGDRLQGTLWTWREEREYFCGILENFLRVAVAHRLVMNGGFLAHGAVVFDGPEALLFIGPSGAGKSTVSKLAIDSGRRIASDDLNPVAIDGHEGANRRIVAGGSPFIGDVGIATEGPRPLRGIYRLEKAEEDAVRPLGAAETVASVFACSPFVNRSPYLRDRLLANIAGIADRVPGHALSFRREGSFWPLVELGAA